jgi:hypothetical protein
MAAIERAGPPLPRLTRRAASQSPQTKSAESFDPAVQILNLNQPNERNPQLAFATGAALAIFSILALQLHCVGESSVTLSVATQEVCVA